MILENKTNQFQTVVLKDGSTISVRPYRDVEVPTNTEFNSEVFKELKSVEQTEVITKKQKGN